MVAYEKRGLPVSCQFRDLSRSWSRGVFLVGLSKFAVEWLLIFAQGFR